jgi:hypothetical protein
MVPQKIAEKLKPNRDMTIPKSQKQIYDKIGRSFCLAFNRVTMYKMDHPYTVLAFTEFYQKISEGFNLSTQIVLIMRNNQLYIEEEPLDFWLNNSGMATHFKKTAIESISFEDGINEAEVENFFKVFCDRRKYPEVEAMRTKIAELGVTHAKINFIFYNKMTTDEKVILEDRLRRILAKEKINPNKELVKEILDRVAEGENLEEIARSISLKKLLRDTAKFSKQLVESNLSANSSAGEMATRMIRTWTSKSPDSIIENQLLSIKDELHRSEPGQTEIGLAQLANTVIDMKAHLLAGVNKKKVLGVVPKNANQMLEEADDIADRIIIQLVKEEYKKGAISPLRLGQILGRIIPDSGGLQRLLLKLKEGMLSEELSVAELVILTKKIGQNLPTDELSDAFKKSAEKIGLDNEGLIRDLKFDLDGAAELICLASHIRNGSGDERVLTELLMDYVERVESMLAFELPLPGGNSVADSSILREMIEFFGSKLVSQLESKDVNSDVLAAVEGRLHKRKKTFLAKLEYDLFSKESEPSVEENIGKTTVFKMLEESVDEGDELQKILFKLQRGIEDKSIDENKFKQIHVEILKIKKAQLAGRGKHLPKEILNYVNTLLYLEKEIYRSLRYDTPFSTLTFSVFDLKPVQPIPAGSIHGSDISSSIMEELINILRDADMLGILNKSMIVVLLPMTDEINAKTALTRILRRLHKSPFIINDISIWVQFAGSVTTCSRERTPDLQSYLSTAEDNHIDLISRLRHVQDLK